MDANNRTLPLLVELFGLFLIPEGHCRPCLATVTAKGLAAPFKYHGFPKLLIDNGGPNMSVKPLTIALSSTVKVDSLDLWLQFLFILVLATTACRRGCGLYVEKAES